MEPPSAGLDATAAGSEGTSEASPLLRRPATPPSTPAIHHHQKQHPQFFIVVLILLTSAFFVSIADSMSRAPWMRIQEDIVCRSYYTNIVPKEFENPLEPIPEARCKIPDVQAKLAMLRGWDQTLSSIPGIVTAVPYGILADKYGRKTVLLLGLVGITLSGIWMMLVGYFSNVFAIEWFWAGNIFLLIGGGGQVAKSTFFTILADVASEEQRAPVFFQLTAAALIATVVAVPLSWLLMKTSNFIPFAIAMGFMFLGTFAVLPLPETKNPYRVPDPADVLPDSDTDSGDHHGDFLDSSKRRTMFSFIMKKIEDSQFIFASPMLCTLTLSFLILSTHANSISLLFQFASERFHWSLANSSFLIPLSAVANFFILVVIFPAIYSILTSQFRLSSANKDLIITRGSILFNIFGALFIAVSPAPALLILAIIIYSFGTGFSAAARSLTTSLVRPDQVSRLYAVLAIADTIGIIVSSPLLSEAYTWGLHIGGLWSGMPFILLAVLYSVTCLPIFLFKLPEVETQDD